MIIQGPFNELIPNSNNLLTQLFVFWDPNLNLETGVFTPVCVTYHTFDETGAL